MVELMITVVIVSVCLALVIRAFSASTGAVSAVYYGSAALEKLRAKMDSMMEDAIMNDGIGQSQVETEEKVGARRYLMHNEVTPYVEPETGNGDADESKKEESGLCVVKSDMSWGEGVRKRTLEINTLIPAQGYREEFS